MHTKPQHVKSVNKMKETGARKYIKIKYRELTVVLVAAAFFGWYPLEFHLTK